MAKTSAKAQAAELELIMKRIDVVKQGDQWVGKQSGRAVTRGATKDETVKDTAAYAKAQADAVSVRIHKQDGTIQEERTYPRRADPTSSPG